MGKKTSFADMVAELPPSKDTRHKSWFDFYPPDVQAQMLEFRACWKAGRYKDKTLNDLIELLKKTFDIKRGRLAIEAWLKSG